MWIARQLTQTITTNLSYLSSWLLLNIFLAMLFLETSEEKKRIGYESLLSQYENFLVSDSNVILQRNFINRLQLKMCSWNEKIYL